MAVLSEFHYTYTLRHAQGGAYTEGYTTTVRFSLTPGQMTVHNALSHVQANNQGPFAGAVGIVSANISGSGTSTYGTSPATWASSIAGNLLSYTVGLHVTRGAITASHWRQVWG